LKWRLVTFGTTGEWARATGRLARQASESGLFEEVVVENEKSLLSREPNFRERFEGWVTTHPRGFGFWIWKPYLISQHLQSLRPGWGLAYMDAGCEILAGASRARRWHDYGEAVSQEGLLSMELPNCREASWSKGDVLRELRNPGDRDSGQKLAGIVLIRNTDYARGLVDTWWQACATSPSLVSDEPSVHPNDPGFIEHRHDQAVWSMVLKNAGVNSIEDETVGADGCSPHEIGPIWAARNRYSRSLVPTRRGDVMKVRLEQATGSLRRRFVRTS
jgi:hypothetical protein